MTDRIYIMTQIFASALERHNLDPGLLDCLRHEWVNVESDARRILEDFVESVGDSETPSSDADPAAVSDFVEAQLTHWKVVCAGTFGEDYLLSLGRLVDARNKLEFGLQWLLTCVNFCGPKLAEVLRRRHRFASARAARFLIAFLEISILDLNISFAENRAQGNSHEEPLDNPISSALKQFEASVSSIAAEAIEKASRVDAIATGFAKEVEATNEKLAYANEVSELVVKRIEKAAEILREVLTAMSDLGGQGTGTQDAATGAIARNREASQAIVGAVAKIDPIIGVISKVAAQTNLLALNARIEAARAGEFGKGFAVIATEVKALAVQTAKATEEISAQIGAIEQASVLSAENIELSCRTIGEIATLGQAMTNAVGEQGDATRRINRNISDAARFAHAASESIATMASLNSQTKQIADELCLLSKSLGRGMTDVQTEAARLRVQIGVADAG